MNKPSLYLTAPFMGPRGWAFKAGKSRNLAARAKTYEPFTGLPVFKKVVEVEGHLEECEQFYLALLKRVFRVYTGNEWFKMDKPEDILFAEQALTIIEHLPNSQLLWLIRNNDEECLVQGVLEVIFYGSENRNFLDSLPIGLEKLWLKWGEDRINYFVTVGLADPKIAPFLFRDEP